MNIHWPQAGVLSFPPFSFSFCSFLSLPFLSCPVLSCRLQSCVPLLSFFFSVFLALVPSLSLSLFISLFCFCGFVLFAPVAPLASQKCCDHQHERWQNMILSKSLWDLLNLLTLFEHLNSTATGDLYARLREHSLDSESTTSPWPGLGASSASSASTNQQRSTDALNRVL